MPKVCRTGDLGATGHLCNPMIGVFATQGSVFANGIPLARLGDPTKPHTIPLGPICVGHMSKVKSSSRTVFARGIGVARIGDAYDMGRMIKGSGTVTSG
jgi:uncharacterized Zn-binding protein involved in type VI secretion